MFRSAALVLAALAAVASLAGPAAAADDKMSYDDPGMHFRPPDDWQRIGIEETGVDDDPSGPRAVAAYVKHKGKQDQRVIVVSVRSLGGASLDSAERSHETDLRNGSDTTFIDKRDLTKLANGMPAFWLRVSQGSKIGNFVRRYEWVVYDQTRLIVVAEIGRQGDFDEKEARDALGSLYVVVYPAGRR